MKKYIAIFMSVLLCTSFVTSAHAVNDEMIYKDGVSNVYTAREDGKDLIKNLNFNDIDANHWAKESITRSGALDMVKGYGNNFSPNNIISNQEAVAFVLRIMGLEKDAQARAITVQNALPENSSLRGLWSIGYLDLARELGIITRQQYNQATANDPNTQDPNTEFVRTAAAKREDIADFIVKGLRILEPNTFASNKTVQGIYTFSDWEDTNVDKAPSVELVISNKIMYGDENGKFRPKGNVTRAEMAQILRNMDSIYYNIVGIARKNGTVSGIKDFQKTQTANNNMTRDLYIRVSDGTVDIIKYEVAQNSSPQALNKDTVVLREGQVTGLASLKENDEVEYLIDLNTARVIYIYVPSTVITDSKVDGTLQSVDFKNGTMTIMSDSGKSFSYNLVKGLINTENNKNYLLIGNKKHESSKLPYGNRFQLVLRNNIVQEIIFIGQNTLIDEFRGIVIENNPEFGYIYVVANDGSLKTMYYNENDMRVEKQAHYDLEDEIGYIDEVFPDFRYDPRDTVISEIEAGDIVFIRPSKDDPTIIEAISASTNYILQYGKVLQYVNKGEYYSMLVEYENKQTSCFDVVDGIFISEDGKPKTFQDIVEGDYVKLLVNQAILKPGHVMESVKEIVIEGDDHFITTIIKGQLAGINNIQKKLQIQNSQKLTQTGWSNYNQINQLSLSDKDTEYYHNNKRISVDYALRYLKRSDGDVYIAVENNYAGDKVKKVAFRDGRDTLLPRDTIISTSEDGSFKILANDEFIKTDDGTIVVKEGRLVNGNNISTQDYAAVSLNNGNTAAVVDISKIAGNLASMFVRARINSIDDGNSFRVQSLAVLDGMEWVYSPVNRDYSIDYNTLFINADGFVGIDKFLDYTENSVVDKVFNVIVDGTKATHIIDSPYAKTGIRGVIYEINGNEVKLKDATYYNNETGRWTPLSNKDNTSVITIPKNSAIASNNKVIFAKDLKVGNQIRVMTDVLPEKMSSGVQINGYIILVEK